MGSEDIKSAITDWSGADEFELVDDLTDTGCDFALGLRARGGVGTTIPVEVLLETGSDRLTIRSGAGSGDGDAARELLDSRPAIVSSQPASGGSGTVIVGHVYVDGFNKNSFLLVVAEVAKTASLLGVRAVAAGDAAGANAAAGGAAEWPTTVPVEPDTWSPQPLADSSPSAAAVDPVTPGEAQPGTWSPQPTLATGIPADAQPVTPGAHLPLPSSSVPEAQPQIPEPTLPTPSFSPQPQAAYTPLSGQPAPQAQPQPSGGGFGPTHTVPPQGMQAWAAPDPAGAVVATLGGGLPIQVTEVRGAWAHVLCSNGWTGWVDGRIIGVAR